LGYKAKPERAFLFHLEAFDWNCPHRAPAAEPGAEMPDAD